MSGTVNITFVKEPSGPRVIGGSIWSVQWSNPKLIHGTCICPYPSSSFSFPRWPMHMDDAFTILGGRRLASTTSWPMEATTSSGLGGLRSGSVTHVANVYSRRDLWTGGRGSWIVNCSPIIFGQCQICWMLMKYWIRQSLAFLSYYLFYFGFNLKMWSTDH